jgi:Ankyrin repeats (3 copies)
MVRRGCIFSLLIWLALAAAYFLFFNRYFEWPGNVLAAFFGSLFGAVMLGAVGQIAWGWRDRRAFARAARREAPQGGQLAVVAGPIRPLAEPLTSPFSGQPCVAYEYEIVDPRRVGKRQRADEHEVVGFAMAACAIDTPDGSVRLIGFPLLDEFPKRKSGDRATRARAESYVASTSFEDMHGIAKLNLIGALDDALADADGVVRKDLRLTPDPIALEHRTLGERVVGVGEQVCAAGLYDSALGALKARGTTLLRLWPGDLAAARRDVVSTTRSNVRMAVLFFVASHAFLTLAWYMSETRHAREMPEQQVRVLFGALDAGDEASLARAVRRGANPDARDSSGTPLLLQIDDPAKVRALIRVGATVDIRDQAGETPLIRAARLGHLDVVQALLAAGADVHARTALGATAVSEARRGAHGDVIEVLQRAGAPDRDAPIDVERRK